jgi:hypothetical protein
VLELELADEPYAGGKGMVEEQYETMKVEDAVLAVGLVEVEIHVPGDGACVRKPAGAGFALLGRQRGSSKRHVEQEIAEQRQAGCQFRGYANHILSVQNIDFARSSQL